MKKWFMYNREYLSIAGYVLMVLAMCVMLIGCASVSYEAPDGTRVSYTRFLTASDNIKAKVGDSNVEANGIKLDLATIQYLVNMGMMAK